MTTPTPTPEPMPTPLGVASGWSCFTRPVEDPPPDPLPDPAQDCYVTAWSTPEPAPTVTATETVAVTVTPTPEPSSTEPQAVILAPAQWSNVTGWGDSMTFGIGGLLLLLIAFSVWHYSRPPSFGAHR